MIKAEELRIGNYIIAGNNGIFYKDGIIGKVLSIGSEEQKFEQIYCECNESFEWFFKDNYFGISLTEEWLLKLGFEVSKGFLYLEIDESNTIRFLHKNTHKVIDLHCAGEDDFGATMITKMCLNHIKHIHQLQNLYFALTGEELTLKND